MPLDFSASWLWPPLLFLLAAFLLRVASFRLSVIDWDESLYLLQAREWLRGGWPLVTTWDMHPVGGPAMVALALLAFGESVASVRLLGLLAVTVTAWILYLTIRILGGPRAVGIGAGLIYVVHTAIRAGLSTNTELLFAPFTCAALAIGVHAFRAQTPLSWRSLVAMGLLVGWALTIKQVVVPLGCLAFALPMLPAYVVGMLSGGEELSWPPYSRFSAPRLRSRLLWPISSRENWRRSWMAHFWRRSGTSGLPLHYQPSPSKYRKAASACLGS